MPAPGWVAQLNKRVTNHLMIHLASRLPGFDIVIHIGNRTPVNVFRRSDRFVVALTFGKDSQWTRNVLANGGCQLITRGKLWPLANPRLFHDERRSIAPAPVRLIPGRLNVSDFLELSLEDQPGKRSGGS